MCLLGKNYDMLTIILLLFLKPKINKIIIKSRKINQLIESISLKKGGDNNAC